MNASTFPQSIPVLGSILLLCTGSAGASPSPGDLVAAARRQVGVTLVYDPAYERLAYPGGDVPVERGVCTDVVIRAYRALDIDLQKLVHEDMKRAFSKYPQIWGLARPDKNIDHRRVPNLRRFFERQGASLSPSRDPGKYLPGDLVTCTLPGNLPHIMIVSDQRVSDEERPMVIHNVGAGAREEDFLFQYPMTGHYRWLPVSEAPR